MLDHAPSAVRSPQARATFRDGIPHPAHLLRHHSSLTGRLLCLMHTVGTHESSIGENIFLVLVHV